jgi:hypothetical protein
MAGSDHLNTDQFKWWHGSPYGGPTDTPGSTGVHVGTREAARQALNARIGRRADGKDWDGSTEYGKTLLAGHNTLAQQGHHVVGYSSDNRHADDHFPDPERSSTPLHVKPALFPVEITGRMSNTEDRPHGDWQANGRMKGNLQRGTARSGYFYKNIAEDDGSISAVVPGWSHLKDLRKS